jgi:hypothetical protein
VEFYLINTNITKPLDITPNIKHKSENTPDP